METKRAKHAQWLSRSLCVVTGDTDLYACPLCLRRFTAYEWDGLTWDHYPPQSIGGRDKHTALICVDCRERWDRIDVQLDRLKNREEHDAKYPGKTPVIVTSPDIRGWRHKEALGIEEDGALGLVGRPELNAPAATQRVLDYMTELELKGGKLTLQIQSDTRFSYERGAIGRAFLKAAYLAAFNRLGYPYILSPSLNKVRLQMRRPELEVPVGKVIQVTPQLNITPAPLSRNREIILAYVHSPASATGLAVAFLGYHLVGDYIVLMPLPAFPKRPRYRTVLQEIKEAKGMHLVVLEGGRDLTVDPDVIIVGEDGRQWPVYSTPRKRRRP